ncbi:MAG TPA: UDP-N-acetylmuramoyl-L-alanyl-D-glutamate--2,6-diaminopimelate ligase [Rhizomicrobium sp.]|nr:UDP-N-acetylmuramoyl-L-alanyl-D-glutamate--2,6-diaminopimelate ligase [Rhizomicrobium sp.]
MTDIRTMPSGFAGLASDSREVRPGYLFAALPGTRADGGAFIADAVRRGAAVVLGLPALRGEAEARGARFIADTNPRRRLAEIAADYFGAQPKIVAAITGTSGKTSVSVFLRQIWEQEGRRAASLGTIGLLTPAEQIKLVHTTPDAITLHRLLAGLAREGIDHLALEASSHGLDQYRLDGVRIAAAGFTNIGRDHMDYHPDFAHYLAAKLRLFELVAEHGVAAVNADAAHADVFIRLARQRNLKLVTVGASGGTLRLVSRAPDGAGQRIEIACDDIIHRVNLPLVGEFQAANALLAAGIATGLGDPPARVLAALELLKGVPGRLEKVAYGRGASPIYVDYAHKPDALETVLKALRPHVTRRLHLVFGCGGDRDRGKRAMMGRIAARLADRTIVTDDNPRTEDPAEIRRGIREGCPDAMEIGDRAEAIRVAIAALETGDALVIAGKGHEAEQIVGDIVRPFRDAEEAVKAALAHGGRADS